MSGIFGVVSKKNCISTLYYGTDYHSHMGTAFGGIAYINESGTPVKKIRDISNSQFKSKFHVCSDKLSSGYGIGSISDKDPQPLAFKSRLGRYAICCSGMVTNKEELAAELIKRHCSFNEIENNSINTTELVANLINQKDNIIDGIVYMQECIKGSVSLLLLTPDGIYCARDKNGITPLVIGQSEDETAVASESCSFPNRGISIKKFMEPGEIAFIGKDGISTKKPGNKNCRICSFLWIYTGFPASSYENINVEAVRENCGRFLAKRDRIRPNLVAGVPDSGISHAIGYAIEAGIPYRRVLMKYTPGYGRSYTPLTQDKRDRIALMKLIADSEIINGNSIVLCEDSIVRGTQLKNYTISKLKDAGAKDIHVRSACPPIMFPCKYMLSTRTTKELIARQAIRHIEGKDISDISEYLDSSSEKYKKMVSWIAEHIGVSSLRYQLLDDTIAAIGLPKHRLCTYCWTGEEI
ncbi:amidophosphoribosyltransferase [Candidatus Woesearchaeota archaeon]|nr:amidophosphoribosyltransferase [Candidatus Woesearchaeota archaeon]